MPELPDKLANVLTADAMSQNVIYVQDTDSLAHAARVLAEYNISGVPVTNQYGHCVGVLSVRDYARHYHHTTNDNFDALPDAQVADYMTVPAMTVSPDFSLLEAGEIMCRRHVHRLPVVDDTGRLVGVLSSLDFIETAVLNYASSSDHSQTANLLT